MVSNQYLGLAPPQQMQMGSNLAAHINGPVRGGATPQQSEQWGFAGQTGGVPNTNQGIMPVANNSPYATTVPNTMSMVGNSSQQNPAIPTGLMGSEQALQNGFTGALGGLTQGANNSLNTLQNTQNMGMNQINQGNRQAMGQLSQARSSGMNSINRGADMGLAALQNAQTQGLGRIDSSFGQAVAGFDPYAQGGQQAFALQGALSGAQGQAAQQQAYDNFLNSPGQSFLKDRGQQALINNSTAIGGLGGGNVRKALVDHGIGMAAQDFQNSYGRLGDISNMGMQATSQQGNLLGQQGSLSSNLLSQMGQSAANVNSQRGQSQANLVSQLGGQAANLAQNTGLAQSNLTSQMGTQGANLQNQLGQNIASLTNDTARNVAAGRTRVGELQSDSIQNTTSALAALANQQGSGLSDILGVNAANLAQLFSANGEGDARSIENLATILANLSAQQGSQLGSQPIITPQTTNTMAQIGQIMGAAGNAYNAGNQG